MESTCETWLPRSFCSKVSRAWRVSCPGSFSQSASHALMSTSSSCASPPDDAFGSADVSGERPEAPPAPVSLAGGQIVLGSRGWSAWHACPDCLPAPQSQKKREKRE